MQHIQRWVTALLLAPLVIWILVKGSTLLLAALICVVTFFSVQEYLRIIFGNDTGPISKTIKAISYICSLALVASASLGSWGLMFLILAMDLMALSIFVLTRFASNRAIFDIIAKQVLGMVYIPVPLSLLVFIKDLDGGTLWVLWLLIVIFANDTGALYTGTFLGKKPLSPTISPKKTVEGACGGVFAGMLAGFIFCFLFFGDLALALLTVPGAFILTLVGQVGDLFESAMKRASRIKDSGSILPGHGGMLDRIDGLLLAIPALYVYLVYIL